MFFLNDLIGGQPTTCALLNHKPHQDSLHRNHKSFVLYDQKQRFSETKGKRKKKKKKTYFEAGAVEELCFSLTGTAGLGKVVDFPSFTAELPEPEPGPASPEAVADPEEKTHLLDTLIASENTLLAPDTGQLLLIDKNLGSTRSGDSEPGKPSLNSVALKFRPSSFLVMSDIVASMVENSDKPM